MKPRLLARLSAVTVITLTGFAGAGSSPDRHADSFRAAVSGAVRTSISGNATFGRVVGGTAAPDVFTINLGTDSPEGAVLFTRGSGAGLNVGSYKVSDGGQAPGEVQALVMLGRPDRPEGVFRVQAGTLTITSISEHGLTGLFALDATGFLAATPERENQRISVSGSFTASATD